ncbi:hypothetical protein QZH41_010356, partial [Actinostola sp. cb2023]
MAEIMTDIPIDDYSIPLDVTYNGECARDYGGPRREFLGAIVKAIKDRLFKEHQDEEGFVLMKDITAIQKQYYYAAGIFFGYSLLQGGPLPCFLHEDFMTSVFCTNHSSAEEERQFQKGLAKFGLIKLVTEKPCLKYLLRKSAVHPMTYPKLVRLLKPDFSEEGTNARTREERSYRLFLNYLKEVV